MLGMSYALTRYAPMCLSLTRCNLTHFGPMCPSLTRLSDTSSEDIVATTIDTVLATVIQQTDSIEAEVAQTADSVSRSVGVQFSMPLDTIANVAYPVDKGRFIPDPKKALWLAMVIPGGGQIYNRKYWKLPLIYGGFIGCVYAMT